jgi:hypothetical protein
MEISIYKKASALVKNARVMHGFNFAFLFRAMNFIRREGGNNCC